MGIIEMYKEDSNSRTVLPLFVLVISVALWVINFHSFTILTALFAFGWFCWTLWIFAIWQGFTISIDDHGMEFGYRFMGKEKVAFDLIDYAEILDFDRKNLLLHLSIGKFYHPVGFGKRRTLVRLGCIPKV